MPGTSDGGFGRGFWMTGRDLGTGRRRWVLDVVLANPGIWGDGREARDCNRDWGLRDWTTGRRGLRKTTTFACTHRRRDTRLQDFKKPLHCEATRSSPDRSARDRVGLSACHTLPCSAGAAFRIPSSRYPASSKERPPKSRQRHRLRHPHSRRRKGAVSLLKPSIFAVGENGRGSPRAKRCTFEIPTSRALSRGELPNVLPGCGRDVSRLALPSRAS